MAPEASSRRVYASAWRVLVAAGFGPLVWFGALAAAGALVGQLAMPWIVGRIIDNALVSGGPRELLRMALWLAAAAAISALCLGLTKIAFTEWGQRGLCGLQGRLLAHLHRLPISFLDKQSSGRLHALFTSDAQRTAALFDPMTRELVSAWIQIILLIAVLYRGYGSMIAFAALLVPIYVVVPILLSRPTRQVSSDIQESAAEAQGLLQEAIEGVRESKITGHGWIRDRVNRGLWEAARQRIRGSRLGALHGIDYVLYWSALGFVYWQGGLGVWRGDLTVGSLVALVSYLGYLGAPVGVLLRAHGQIQGLAGALGRLDAFFRVTPEAGGSRRLAGDGVPLVELRHVSFTYEGRIEPALDDLSLRVEPGQQIAIVGPSGAGKSTLFKLLLRLHDPDGGEIRFDGIPLPELDLDDLRSSQALVPQEPFLYSLDVRENIRLGDCEADDEKVKRVALMAHALDFIRDLPRGFETPVGERGVALSVGQKQRLAIARAGLRRAGIVLLDEATSALDAESEHKVRRGLEELTRGRTTFIIAHRLQTVTEVDRILVLEKGRLVADGSHAELLRTCRLYRRLYELQASALPNDALPSEPLGEGDAVKNRSLTQRPPGKRLASLSRMEEFTHV